MTQPQKTLLHAASAAPPPNQPTIIVLLLLVGSVLAFIGTPVLYVAYAFTEPEKYMPRRGPVPIITDVFGDWPVLTHAVTGAGLTLLFTGVLGAAMARIPPEQRNTIAEFCVLAQASLWLILPTSQRYPEGSALTSGIHYGATFVLMGSSIYALYQVADVCAFYARELQMHQQGWWAEAAKQCVWVAVLGIVGATVSGGATAVMGRESNGEVHALWTMLAVSELTVVLFGGIGYFVVIYVYYRMEEMNVAAAAAEKARGAEKSAR
jgi:hypothetical protein